MAGEIEQASEDLGAVHVQGCIATAGGGLVQLVDELVDVSGCVVAAEPPAGNGVQSVLSAARLGARQDVAGFLSQTAQAGSGIEAVLVERRGCLGEKCVDVGHEPLLLFRFFRFGFSVFF
ncbi:hypothetical protein ABVG11_37565 [Streptomyces sp. HD1123-B1]|uniref:hypothetical protein n=1 Tax=Streptomyces huangiella TaxID=3228804 RepID=UPI003D7D10D5